jgi:hypothetical protein
MGEPTMDDQKYLLSHVWQIRGGNTQPTETPPDEVEVLVIELTKSHSSLREGEHAAFTSK